jgi:hypothetical protein
LGNETKLTLSTYAGYSTSCTLTLFWDNQALANILRDFDWSFTGVTVRKTGARVPFDHVHLSEVYHWIVYFFSVLFSKRGRGGPTIGFSPDPARPWYLIWPSLFLSGGRASPKGTEPDVWMHFEDATHANHVSLPDDGKPRWNFEARDLSKSAVAAAFETAFGYGLALDPRSCTGVCVEKGEANGIHDGAIVTLPCEPKPGKVYQHLVDNRGSDGLVEDLRTPTVGGKPVFVYIKRRNIEARFTNDNSDCWLRRVEDVFSPTEIAAIERFCAILKLDWGGLDILRDASSGLIYIVDANRTDMGPPIALPLSDKIDSTRQLATALQSMFEATQQKAVGA